MKHNSTMLAITWASSLRVTGGRHIRRINLAAGCRMSKRPHQVNSITLWTLTKDRVSTCDISHVAFRCNSILPKHDWTEFSTHVACRANEPLFIHGRWGKKSVSPLKIETFHSTDQGKTHGENIVHVYSEWVVPGSVAIMGSRDSWWDLHVHWITLRWWGKFRYIPSALLWEGWVERAWKRDTS